MSDIIDNRNFLLSEAIKKMLSSSDSAKFVIGYFFLSGFKEISEFLKDLKEIKILIGNTTNKETIEQLVEGYKKLDKVRDVLEKEKFLNKNETKTLKNDTSKDIKETIEYMDQDERDEEIIKSLDKLISEGKVNFKIYTKGRVHAKAYIFDYKEGKGYEKGIAIVGSSNLTLSGLTNNTELNVVVNGNENHNQLTKWFEELWNESEDFNEDLMKTLENSWVLNENITPYDIYIKTIYSLIEREEYIPTILDFPFLTNFQRDALRQAINIIEKFGGVFISDVVGLGKTYIGAALIDYYNKVKGEKTFVICPASLKDMWEDIIEKYDLNSHVLSMGKLSERNFNIFEEKKFRDRSVVLIDESHEFRHTETIRYRNLSPFLQDKKVIFLTATPRCNTHWDIYNQIKLFHPEDSINEFSINPPNMREFFRNVDEGKAKLKEFLRNILIRRTRKFILKWYGKEDENGKKYVEIGDKKQYFPQRILQTQEYNIEKTYNGLYDKIREKIKELTLARYNLYDYVYTEYRTESPYLELKQASQSLKGLMRVILFKRLESSVEAFKKTISNLINLNWLMVEAIKTGFIPAGEEAQKYMYQYKAKEEEDFFETLEELSEKYDTSAFDVDKLMNDINADIEILQDIDKMISKIDIENDDKFNVLKNLIEKKLKNQKVLIFTEYSDTADYLYNNLNYLEKVEKVDSKRKDWMNVIKRFAPRSNIYEFKNGEEEIEILISTDILSQGLNLQDAYIVINYDLHWNPVRLIQRIGRIDRIGAINDKVYCFNFLPEKEIEKHLGLKERLSRRIQEIHDTIGEDTKILDETEKLNEEEMYAIYSGDEKILDREDEEESLTLEELKNIINEIEKNDPQYLEKIKNMQDGVRSYRGYGEEKYLYTYLKCGDYEKLYLLNEKGDIVDDDLENILTQIKCEPYENIGKKDKEMFKIIPDVKRKFEEEVKMLMDKKIISRKLTPQQNYVLEELQFIYEKNDNPDIKEVANKYSEIFKKELIPIVQKELRIIKRENYKDKFLLEKLREIINKYNLLREKKEEEIRKEEDRVKIICSEIINK
ncbi:MAG TPA: helicase-related protein [Caldisericia bacterium]|nr:helicase-related protein [Caldisericia bacterium]